MKSVCKIKSFIMSSKYNLKPYFKPAWVPTISETCNNSIISKFAGVPLLCKNESWPLCGNCQNQCNYFYS